MAPFCVLCPYRCPKVWVSGDYVSHLASPRICGLPPCKHLLPYRHRLDRCPPKPCRSPFLHYSLPNPHEPVKVRTSSRGILHRLVAPPLIALPPGSAFPACRSGSRTVSSSTESVLLELIPPAPTSPRWSSSTCSPFVASRHCCLCSLPMASSASEAQQAPLSAFGRSWCCQTSLVPPSTWPSVSPVPPTPLHPH